MLVEQFVTTAVAVATDAAGNAKSDAGESYLIFGKSTGFADIDLATLTAAQGFRILGVDVGDYSGFSVSGAGDVNGDGFDMDEGVVQLIEPCRRLDLGCAQRWALAPKRMLFKMERVRVAIALSGARC